MRYTLAYWLSYWQWSVRFNCRVLRYHAWTASKPGEASEHCRICKKTVMGEPAPAAASVRLEVNA